MRTLNTTGNVIIKKFDDSSKPVKKELLSTFGVLWSLTTNYYGDCLEFCVIVAQLYCLLMYAY